MTPKQQTKLIRAATNALEALEIEVADSCGDPFVSHRAKELRQALAAVVTPEMLPATGARIREVRIASWRRRYYQGVRHA